ncbi:hypothetical protein [Corynebacterium spheniscorum]|uniref:Protein-tyrosine phosphatase n=1 Tax=Corynebacterium spheniscorum TaxID=185761 RepID=A0A1I2T9V1_9CORY|nr:hypothetical protein [Corynebacterium spheniscorum]SFG60017.1 protein-tyrosine phosphatase [Corynebacterium spheniscorum]
MNTVLFICQGNICRSPMAETLTRQYFPQVDPSRIRSAGLGAVVGAGMDGRSKAALAAANIPADASFVSRQFTAPMVDNALVLTMSQRQSAELAKLAPNAIPRTFTLGELAALCRTYPGESVKHMHRSRRLIEPAPDIPDPVREDPEVFHRTLELIDDYLRDIDDLFADWFEL